MLKVEKWLINTLSVGALSGLFILKFGLNPIIMLALVLVYIGLIYLIESSSESNNRIENAVNLCIEESEFNVIDKVEQLRLFFKDTNDLIEYLTCVDSRVLAYVFDDSNNELSYKEYINGAMQCLAFYMGFYGSFYLSIDRSGLAKKERIKALLSSLYLASKHINNGCDSVHIYSRQGKDSYTIDVIDDNNMGLESDFFSDKLLTLFSSDSFILSRSYL